MPKLTPMQYVQKYKSVPIIDARGRTERRVRLDSYLMYTGQDLPEKSRFTQALRRRFRRREEFEFKVETVHGTRADISVSTKHAYTEHGVDAFYGKASPEDIQFTLQIARQIGLTSLPQMQSWCNAHIGVDCSGFVGNYLWHVFKGRRWNVYGDPGENQGPGPSTGIRSMCKAPFVRHVSELKKYPDHIYVLGACDRRGVVYRRALNGVPAHVMITEPGTWRFRYHTGGIEPRGMVVCESVSGGPVASAYTFDKVRDGIFWFRRGCKNNRRIRVRIHRLRYPGEITMLL